MAGPDVVRPPHKISLEVLNQSMSWLQTDSAWTLQCRIASANESSGGARSSLPARSGHTRARVSTSESNTHRSVVRQARLVKLQADQLGQQLDVRNMRGARLVFLFVAQRNFEAAAFDLDIQDRVPGVGLAVQLQAILLVDGHRAKGNGLACVVSLSQRRQEQRHDILLNGLERAPNVLDPIVQDHLVAAALDERVLAPIKPHSAAADLRG